MSVRELLQATRELEQSLQEQLAEARSFKNQLEKLDRDYDWVQLPFERICAGRVGIVAPQNWLFQVTKVHETWLEIEIYDEIESLYRQDNDGAIFTHPDECFETIYEEDDEDFWGLPSCLFAVYRSED
jgi:hypothetical protein